MPYRLDIGYGRRTIAECTVCGERVPFIHVTKEWLSRHEHEEDE